MPMKDKGLNKLTEEAGELATACSKYIACNGGVHWDGQPTVDKVMEEIADVRAAIDFVIWKNDLDVSLIEERAAKKLSIFHSWDNEESDQ